MLVQTVPQKQKQIKTSEDYINSLRNRKLKVYLFGELVEDIVEHPMIRPSINAVAETYDLAEREPELATRDFASDGRKSQSFFKYRNEPRRSCFAEQNAEAASDN